MTIRPRLPRAKRHVLPVFILASALAGASCDSPTDPSDDDDNGTASCRTAAATSQAVQTFSDGQVVSTSSQCSFNSALIEVVCELVFTDSLSGPGTGTQTTRWAARADIVDEVAVIPPRARSLATTTALTIGGLTFTTTAAHSYDAQRRLQSIAISAPTATGATTYTAWDAAGRPTAGTTVLATPGGTVTIPESITYNNATRTLTRVSGLNTCTLTHDQNGEIIQEVCTGTTPSTTTRTVQTTQQICR